MAETGERFARVYMCHGGLNPTAALETTEANWNRVGSWWCAGGDPADGIWISIGAEVIPPNEAGTRIASFQPPGEFTDDSLFYVWPMHHRYARIEFDASVDAVLFNDNLIKALQRKNPYYANMNEAFKITARSARDDVDIVYWFMMAPYVTPEELATYPVQYNLSRMFAASRRGRPMLSVRREHLLRMPADEVVARKDRRKRRRAA
jgi:hypothetical protein